MLLVPAGGAMTTHPRRACGRSLRSSADSLVNNQWLFVCSPAAACSRLGPVDAAITASSSSNSLTRLQQTESSASVIASQVHRVGRHHAKHAVTAAPAAAATSSFYTVQ